MGGAPLRELLFMLQFNFKNIYKKGKSNGSGLGVGDTVGKQVREWGRTGELSH